MPTALLRHCNAPGGCSELVSSGRCHAHRQEQEQHRGTAHERGYGARWRGFRKWFINQLIARSIGPFCGARLPGAQETTHSLCAAARCTVAGTEVDHITPHKGDQQLMWDRLNLQLLCKRCHSRKTAMEDMDR